MKEIDPSEYLETTPTDINPPHKFKKGDRFTWTGAPSWWNPAGEEIWEHKGNTVQLAYWRSPIPISELILVLPPGEVKA